jgi:CheY-like chemotaxis protein
MDQDKKTVVLVADDEPSTLAMVSSHLRSKGYSVLEASDGDQAWELAHEHLPHLVVLDVMMPGMSGWEVCRKIREAVSLAHTGVVMLTGIGENLNEMTSPLYGADAHVDKPFEFSNLDRKIAATLERRKAGEVGRGHDRDEPAPARKRAQKTANGLDRPTLPAIAPPPSESARKKLRILTPKPLVKAKPGRKPAAKKAAATKPTRAVTTKTQRTSPRAKTTTAARGARGSAKRQVRTSTMKDKPRAKTTAAKKAPAAKAISVRFFKARLPMRSTASSTTARIAAFRPKKSADTSPT